MMNHVVPLCYIFGRLIQDHMINRTWRTTQENSASTRHMLCLGLLISELGVRYALPDKGWGLAGSGIWTCSGVGVGLAKTL
jgi:hypothetical protein